MRGFCSGRHFIARLRLHFALTVPLLFEKGLPCCAKLGVELYLHDNVKPVHLPPHPIACAFKDQVGKEFDLANGMLEAVEQFDCATPIVVVKKRVAL